MRKLLSVMCVLMCVVVLVGCAPVRPTPTVDPNKYASVNLMEGVESSFTPTGYASYSDSSKLLNFSTELFTHSLTKGKNSLVSPLSVLYALAMTANGAKGETLQQMQSTLGLDVDKLNNFLYHYNDIVSKDDVMHIANGIWFANGRNFVVNNDFLQTNANYYNAGAYSAPFDDSTLNDINNFVNFHTKGMIDKILDEISKDAIMYLVNALAFEAKWENSFGSTQDGMFYANDGPVERKLMSCEERTSYLHDENCIGAMKYYDGGRYAFVGLLPNEGVDVDKFSVSLTADKLNNLLTTTQNGKVLFTIPKFTADYSAKLNQTLCDMGMPMAFDKYNADFSGLGYVPDENIYIGKVLHKTFVEVSEEGTKAGAATVVEMEKTTSVGPNEEKTYTVCMNRPFVYLIMDTQFNLPIFIGTYFG